jgi:hypothetical protein
MNNASRIVGWFVGLLVAALSLDYAFLWARSSLLIASINWESQAWSIFRGYGGVEATYWLFCLTFFAVSGALLTAKARSFLSAAVFALLLGVSFSVIVWLNGPRVYYSHAPLWLWALGWADLYVPTIAAGLGALSWRFAKSGRIHEPHAA